MTDPLSTDKRKRAQRIRELAAWFSAEPARAMLELATELDAQAEVDDGRSISTPRLSAPPQF